MWSLAYEESEGFCFPSGKKWNSTFHMKLGNCSFNKLELEQVRMLFHGKTSKQIIKKKTLQLKANDSSNTK